MKRIWRISQFSDLLCLSRRSEFSTSKTVTPFCFTLFRSPVHPPFHQSRIPLFNHHLGSPSPSPGDVLIRRASELKKELLRYCNDSDKVASILDGFLIQGSGEGAAFVELLRQLRPWPVLSQVVSKILLTCSDFIARMVFFKTRAPGTCVAGLRLEKKQGPMRWGAYDT